MATEAHVVRHVPWTCQWGEFGHLTQADACRAAQASANGREATPWLCLRPTCRPARAVLLKGDCEICPFWLPAIPRAVP